MELHTTLTVERFCQATGELIEVDLDVIGTLTPADPSVGVPAGIEDLDVSAEIDGICVPFELTDAETWHAEEALWEAAMGAAEDAAEEAAAEARWDR